ncbi:uncharacterized protein LOC125038370 [Penaeus chinensis]|uniref:uncharacterized protein LOC125038370 n=1 Tax=Penaeus chinensis TaxID=139456 RepID=UPI001FB789D8|nr:uncharacterized protein LOC125038370 [Penaeus chinensis]
MTTNTQGSRGTPADLSRILKKVKNVLEDQKSRSSDWRSSSVDSEAKDADLSVRDAAGHLDDVNEAFGACQTVEWKEQEYRYLRSKLMGHRRRDATNGSNAMLLGSATLPAVHKALMRSLSTPDPPQVEPRSYKSFLRQRRASLALEADPPGSCGCGVRDAKNRKRRSEIIAKDVKGKISLEREIALMREMSNPECAKIVSFVKSSAWASRESILSTTSRSFESSEEDAISVVLNTSVVGEVSEEEIQKRQCLQRSVSEETLIYQQEGTLEKPQEPSGDQSSNHECEGKHALGDSCSCCQGSPLCLKDDPGGSSTQRSTSSMKSIFDSIPHIDSSSEDEGEDFRAKTVGTVPSPASTPEKHTKDFPPECPPLCLPEEDFDTNSADDCQVDPECHDADQLLPSQTKEDGDDGERLLPAPRCGPRRSPRPPTRTSSLPRSAADIDLAAAVCTGGVSIDDTPIIEVFDCSHPQIGAAMSWCCSAAHSSSSSSSPPTTPPRLLLVHGASLDGADAFLEVLKARLCSSESELRVWAVTQSSTEDDLVRTVTQRNDVRCDVVSLHELHQRISLDQLSSQFGGTLEVDHQAWQTFCKLREGLLDSMRCCVSTLQSRVQPTSASPSPNSSSERTDSLSTSPKVSSGDHPTVTPGLRADVRMLRDAVDCAMITLKEMEPWCQKLEGNKFVRAWFAECSDLIGTMASVVAMADSHAAPPSPRLEQFKKEATAVVTWLLGRGEETLARHQTLADTLTGITRQETEFQKFYSVAMRHLEKGGSLLQEAAAPSAETEPSVRELARALHLHLTQFTERLHHTRDRLEDTARCYHLLDKSYEWALEAMKVVGRVKGEGLASPEQVGSAARALTAYLEEHPPIADDTFTAMNTLATRLNNHTLLQQCKMAQMRCQETSELLRNRQAILQKAKRQMEFDCQSFVDLGEILGGGEDMSPLAWLASSPLNASGRRRSVSSVGSRPRESLSRCPSLDTDDDSVFLDPPPPPPPAKTPLEARTSLGGIKEVRESAEDLQQSSALPTSTSQKLTTSTSGVTTSSSGSSGTSGSSSCSSSESSGPVSINKKFMKRANTWQFGLVPKDENTSLDDGGLLSPSSHKTLPPSSSVNSHLLIRGSQLNLSINTEDLTQAEVKKNKTLLLIMRELIQTERDYVNALEYIIENYIPELMREDIPQALRGQRNVIFGNIEKIYEFHSGYFLRALEACEMRPFSVGSIFLRYESQFYLYALYNKNKPKSDALMSEYGSSFFRAMQLELKDRMDLASYLLKPVQRMGKYALILKQLLKECARGDEHYEDLQSAQEMVQFQLRHGNDLLAMDSLRDCDVNLKEQGRLLRQGEFMVWEGSRAKKSIRHVFLFEDLILFSKARRDPEKKTLDIFQYKYSMKMTDIGLTEQVGDSTTKFEIWFRKRKPSDTYLLQAHNAEMKEAWTEEISKLLWRQALRNRTMRLHEMSSMGIGNKPCLDIRPSEDQISDRSISINQLNKAPRLRSGSISTIGELNGVGKRPHSIISVSSSSASSSASSASSTHSSTVCPTHVGTLNLGFEPGDSPRALHRSVTRTSQCSAESGILADMYSGGDEDTQSHRRVERSNSTVTTISVDSALSPVPSTSPVSPAAPILPSLTTVLPFTGTSDVIYEVPPTPSTSKDSTAKTLLTTEV